MKRLAQLISIYQGRLKDLKHVIHGENIFIEDVRTAEEMLKLVLERIEPLISVQNVRLVLIDSIAALFRTEYENDEISRRSEALFKLSNKLKTLSRDYVVPIVVINQVSDMIIDNNNNNTTTNTNKQGDQPLSPWCTKPYHPLYPMSSGRRVTPALGLTWSACVNTRVLLTRNDTGPNSTDRAMHVIFSPCLPRTTCPFVVDSMGLHGLALG